MNAGSVCLDDSLMVESNRVSKSRAPSDYPRDLPVQVRPAEPKDLSLCKQLDHSCLTDRVWQMDTRRTSGAWRVVFRTVRLPREIKVSYPRRREDLLAGWRRRDGFIVAEMHDRICGYATLAVQPEHGILWVGDLVVDRSQRQRGIGTALLKAAAVWGSKQDLIRLTLEVQTKNYPAIRFCQACGLTFCGYNDHYWASQDIAVFFTGRLH